MTGILTNLNRIIINRSLFFLFTLFLLVQTILFIKIGVFTGLEAEKYVTQGNLLYDTGRLSDIKYIFYLPVILLVYVCRLLGTSYHLIVFIQIALSGLSLFYFYKLGKNIGNTTIAFYSSVLLVLFVPLQLWNFYLYSDSIFISLTIIYVYVVYTYRDKGLKGFLFILSFLALLIFSRPNGILFIPPLIIYLLFRKEQSSQQRIIGVALSAFLLINLYFIINTAFTGGGDLDIIRPFIEEHIICFVPTKPDGVNLDITRTANPVNDLSYYIIHNPFHFLRLTLSKLFSFFNLTRSYYSTLHNICLLIFSIPVYLFSITGIFHIIKSDRNLSLFIISFLILYPLTISFQCDDWHSRFTMVVFPYFILLACIGFASIFGKKSANS